MVQETCAEIDLIWQRGIRRNGAERGMGEEPLIERGTDASGVAWGRQAPHGFAELGFLTGGAGNCHLPSGWRLALLGRMRCSWQVAGVWLGMISGLVADGTEKLFVWNPPKAAKNQFSAELGLLDAERDEYATNLAILASNVVAHGQASAVSIESARRWLGLALQLSPRNKRAVIANFQLSKGLLPAVGDCLYEPKVFARLLLTRGQLLEKTEGVGNKQLARYFIDLAAEFDPKNDEAVYASEMQRLDHGPINWALLTDGK